MEELVVLVWLRSRVFWYGIFWLVYLAFANSIIDFAAMDGCFFGGLYTKTDVFAAYVHDGDGYVVVDDDTFVAFAAKN